MEEGDAAAAPDNLVVGGGEQAVGQAVPGSQNYLRTSYDHHYKSYYFNFVILSSFYSLSNLFKSQIKSNQKLVST